MWKVCGVLYLKIAFNTRKKPKCQKRQSPEALLYKGFGALENISILNSGPEGRIPRYQRCLSAHTQPQ